jgi:hypothetical protein
MNDDELRFLATGRKDYWSDSWIFYFDSVDGVVDKIVEWENMPAKSCAAFIYLENWQSFYVDIIEKLVARNRTENIACSACSFTRLEGTEIKMCHVTREVFARRLKQKPNKKIKFRGNVGGDEAKIVAGTNARALAIHHNLNILYKRMIFCVKNYFKIYSPTKGKRVDFEFRHRGSDPYWPPEIIYLDMPRFRVEECCVCFESCERAPRLACGHGLCRSCFDSWKRVRSTCPMCRSPFSASPLDIVEAFNAEVAARPVGELWDVEKDVAEIVAVSPWRWKDFTNLREKPSRLFIDVDCILTTDVDRSRDRLRRLVRIKRQKILCFAPSPR